MKIEIDTKFDSTEDIKKAIKLLQTVIGEKGESEFIVKVPKEHKDTKDTKEGKENIISNDSDLQIIPY